MNALRASIKKSNTRSRKVDWIVIDPRLTKEFGWANTKEEESVMTKEHKLGLGRLA